jgi:hypothetical protein
VLRKLEVENIRLDTNVLSPLLDHAVLKGQLHLLGEVMKIGDVHALLNAKESKAGHDNTGGNRILYMAASYTRQGFPHTAQQKKDDVLTALSMVSILHQKGRGAEMFPNNKEESVMDVLSRRIDGDAPELRQHQYYQALQSVFGNQLAAARVRAEEEARVEVQKAHGLLLGGPAGNPFETRRLMLEQLKTEADDMQLTGADRTAWLREGLASLSRATGGNLALGPGAPTPSELPAKVKRDEPPEIVFAEVEVISPDRK